MRKRVIIASVTLAVGLSFVPISMALASPAPAATGPSITNFSATPKTFSHAGGVLHYSAALVRTKTYTLRVTPGIAGLPRTLPAHPRVSGTLRIPANHTHQIHDYLLALSTYNGVNKRVTIKVGPIPTTGPTPPTTTPPTTTPPTTTPPTTPPVTTPPVTTPPVTTPPVTTPPVTTPPVTTPPVTTPPVTTPPVTTPPVTTPPTTPLPTTPVLTLNYTGNPSTENGEPAFSSDGGTLDVTGGADDSGATATYLSCTLAEPQGTVYLSASNNGLQCDFTDLAVVIPAETYGGYWQIKLTATAYNETTGDQIQQTKTVDVYEYAAEGF
jgi:hypothetical protein